VCSTPAAQTQRELRFREALADFRTLCGRPGGAPPVPFHLACLDRWRERWSDRTLRGLNATEVLAYFRELAWKGHTNLELERERSLFRALYRWAQRTGRVRNDPTASLGSFVALPRAPAPAWSPTEQRRLLDAARGLAPVADGTSAAPTPVDPASARVPLYLYPLILLGLRTGLRLDEVLRLEWRHVNLWRARIRTAPGELRGAAIDLPLPTDAAAVLGALRRFAGRFDRLPTLVFAAAGLPLVDGEPDEECVLAAFRKARELAGLAAGNFAALRLAFARNCATAGVPMKHVVAVYDWGDRETLEAIYEEHGSPAVARPNAAGT
jgi:integrase